jgi:hypothetical protein
VTGFTLLDQRADEAERQAAALRKIAEGARELGPNGLTFLLTLAKEELNATDGGFGVVPKPAPSALTEPRGREAIRLIVASRPGLWSLADLRAELKCRSWFTSNKAVEVAVTRLCATGNARRVGKGLYEFPDPTTEEAEAA